MDFVMLELRIVHISQTMLYNKQVLGLVVLYQVTSFARMSARYTFQRFLPALIYGRGWPLSTPSEMGWREIISFESIVFVTKECMSVRRCHITNAMPRAQWPPMSSATPFCLRCRCTRGVTSSGREKIQFLISAGIVRYRENLAYGTL